MVSSSQSVETVACDVVVVGGGPAGIGAAVAAARCGASTVLVERHDVLGGMGTAALVNNFCPAHLDGTRLIIGGVFAELRERLIGRRALHASPAFAYQMEPYNPAVFAQEADALCRASGVSLRMGCSIADVAFGQQSIEILLESGSQIHARVAVDATGDALLASRAGCTFHPRGGSGGKVMPLTYCYKIGPIDMDRAAAEGPGWVGRDPTTGERTYGACAFGQDQIRAARAAGDLTIPREDVAAVLSVPGEPENVTVNFGRVFVEDPTDPAQLAQADAEGRRQVEEGIAFFRKYFPAYRNVRLLELARQIGVRESRQVQGLSTLTGEDVLACRQFAEVIAQCCYAIDIHQPDGHGSRLIELPRGTHYDIPLGCLVPANGAENLVIAGRCISADHTAMSSFRVSPSVMAIGEAAGVTAALALKRRCVVRAVPVADVQSRLLETGGILS